MTRLHGDRANPPVNEARVHAFIVGVGRYAHLDPVDSAAYEWPDNPGLGQLTSPPVSAAAFARWVLHSLNSDLPLGEVELLVSGGSGTFARDDTTSVPVESATIANVQAAFDNWYAHADAHEGNVLFFYWCGHGLESDALALLTEDFASNRLRPWDSAVNFHETYDGMARCKAYTQCFFIDACRQVSLDLFDDVTFGGQPLIAPRRSALDNRVAPRIFATAHGLEAFGKENKVSRYTKALIDALDGAGADKRRGRWRVTTHQLGSAVARLVKARGDARQRVQPGGTLPQVVTLHTLARNKVPEVEVVMRCREEDATGFAKFSIAKDGAVVAQRPDPQDEPFTTTVTPGAYDLAAHFEEGVPFAPIVWPEEPIRPPVFDLPLEHS